MVTKNTMSNNEHPALIDKPSKASKDLWYYGLNALYHSGGAVLAVILIGFFMVPNPMSLLGQSLTPLPHSVFLTSTDYTLCKPVMSLAVKSSDCLVRWSLVSGSALNSLE